MGQQWYDFALYGAASALIFGPLFFPQQSSVGGTLASFAIFAVAFFVRPLGGLIAAHVGDRIGRKPILVFTVTLMGVATVAVGLPPTYESIGIWAPILLVLTRLLQGIGAGAEFAGAVTAVAEYVPRNRRGFYTSFSQASVGLAFVLSTGLFSLLAAIPRDALPGGAWRIPFIASIAIFGVAIFIRRRVEETPEFVEVKTKIGMETTEPQKIPLLRAIKESPPELIVGILCGSGLNVAGYLVNTFSLSYVKNTLEMSATVATLGVVVATGASVVTVPLFGLLADRFGRWPVLLGGAVFTALYMPFYFLLLDTRQAGLVLMAMGIAYGVGQSAMPGSQGAFLSELFATRYRFTAIAASREINVMILGGTTPFIATALVAASNGSPWLVVLFVVACQVRTIASVLLMRTTRNHDAENAASNAEPRNSVPVTGPAGE
ncbi:MFS transporter [Saccharopolyspora phatthalungensis]|uniref:MFS family permease n=1 Tax=Saccharopolyspora phatthalungensis TaxID=664693 RepID=A0A840QK46_9PSEU|nr:MFS transporter [Saccharopolyspora phatthalungensis]MBB5159918.1 MFS family permease [Saccharopolyspora phatthalungensis]